MSETSEQRIKNALQNLPELTPPASVWREVSSTTRGQRHTSTYTIAAAAVLVVSVASLLFLEQRIGSEQIVTGPARITELVSRSQQLEHQLRAGPRLIKGETPTMRVLSGRIATIDTDLFYGPASTDQAEELWQQRVSLMESYVNLQRDRDAYAIQRISY